MDSQGIMASGWRAAGASAAGSSHARRGIACQDACVHQITPGGALIAAVADGLGSAGRADRGAATAVRQAARYWQTALEENPPQSDEDWLACARRALAAARQAIVVQATHEGEALTGYATTLTCAVCCADRLTIGHIGDGFVVAQQQDGRLITLAHPMRGEYANEVIPLTAGDALSAAQAMSWQALFPAVCLSTDGLLRLALKLPGALPLAGFFTPLWQHVAGLEPGTPGDGELAAFLASSRVRERTDDDVTLVVAARVPPTG